MAWHPDGGAALLRRRDDPTVLTPHDGEFGLLTGQRPGPDRFAAARRLAADTGTVVVLKGPTTMVAEPGGDVRVVASGDARLATAGTGDVLAGVLGALLATGMATFDAASAAPWIHAEAALLAPPSGWSPATSSTRCRPCWSGSGDLAAGRPLGVGGDRPRRRRPQRRRPPGRRRPVRGVGRRQGRRLRPRRRGGRPGGDVRRMRRSLRGPHRRGRGPARCRPRRPDPRPQRATSGARRDARRPPADPDGDHARGRSTPSPRSVAIPSTCTSRSTPGCTASAPRPPPSPRSSSGSPTVPRHVRLAGVFTHLAVADEPANDYTARQLACFDAVLAGLPPAPSTASPSTPPTPPVRWSTRRPAGRSCAPASPCTASRPVPTSTTSPPASARCSSLRAKVSFVKRLPAGSRLSYGLRHTLTADATVATRPLGYADGVRRGLSSNGDVLIGGRRRPIIGTVTMDQLMVDCGDDPVRRRRRRRADRPPGRRAHHRRGVGRDAWGRSATRSSAASAPRARACCVGGS